MIEPISYNDYVILEKKIASLKDTITIEIGVDMTAHAEERQERHEEPIKEKEILDSLNKALDRISERQLKGFDKLHQKYWVYDHKNKDLNIIAEFKRDGSDVKLTVVTIMRKKKFYGSSDTIKIEV